MKKDWRNWKFLRFEETGLGWDPVMGKVSGTDEWWDRKIKVSLFHKFLQLFFNDSYFYYKIFKLNCKHPFL